MADEQIIKHESGVEGQISLWTAQGGKRMYSVKFPCPIPNGSTAEEIEVLMQAAAKAALAVEKTVKSETS